ncbi:hypothetical protein DVH24_034505 [Malus domestica]|uniref:Uncharacterized protein n=1 Tax=Malus domestica TaxID=3750 RepID=A0A498IZ45_MALDO|nr:hypothetical protein DVH24_034505 [Malus domestica]
MRQSSSKAILGLSSRLFLPFPFLSMRSSLRSSPLLICHSSSDSYLPLKRQKPKLRYDLVVGSDDQGRVFSSGFCLIVDGSFAEMEHGEVTFSEINTTILEKIYKCHWYPRVDVRCLSNTPVLRVFN